MKISQVTSASMVKMDFWHVDKYTVIWDLKFLLRTVWAVINRSGISSDAPVTMEEFTGTNMREGGNEH